MSRSYEYETKMLVVGVWLGGGTTANLILHRQAEDQLSVSLCCV